MKHINYIFLIVLGLLQFSCVKDPLKEIKEGEWNNERSIIGIMFENQVGQPEINRIDDQSGEIMITINVDAVPDLSQIMLSSLQVSYGANASVNVGESLNFENTSQSAAIVVTSPTGKSREYNIIVSSFQETLTGTYEITNLVVYGGTGPEYGGAGVIPMMDKPWIWPETDGPGAELDNTITFELSGMTEDGNTYGNFINDPGEDGLYGNFYYNREPFTDVNNFYRKLPKENGEWLRNYATGEIIFTFADGSTSAAKWVEPGTEDFPDNRSKTTPDNALSFNLRGTDDWDNIYSDYDKFVKRPRKYWIDIKKIE